MSAGLLLLLCFFFFFNDTATTEIYTLSLHDALPIYAEAVNHRDRRLGRALDRVQHAVEEVVILGDRAALGARFVEFRDVGAGGERLGAGAAERDAAHFAIGVEARHRLRDAAPHGAVDRVAPLRIVENDPADARLLLDFQAHGLPAGP